MLIAFGISLVFSLAFGVELLRWKPTSDGTRPDRDTLKSIWQLCVVLSIVLGIALLVQRHEAAQRWALEQRVGELEQQVNSLEEQVAALDNNKVDRR